MSCPAGTATRSAYPPPASSAQTSSPTAQPSTPSPTSSDPSGALQARVRRGARRRGVVPLPLQQVGPVDRRRDDLDDDLARPGGRVGHLLPGQLVRPARLRHDDRPHATQPPTHPRTRSLVEGQRALRVAESPGSLHKCGTEVGQILVVYCAETCMSLACRRAHALHRLRHRCRLGRDVRPAGVPRPAYAALLRRAAAALGASDLRFRADQLAGVFTDRGVTFAYAGEERPFPLDLIPRIIDAAEWDTIDAGVQPAGRARWRRSSPTSTGRARCFADGVVPRAAGRHQRRTSTARRAGIEPPNGVRVHVAGIDLIRDEAGRVPGARGQRPRPVRVSATCIENRRAMTQVLPEPVRRATRIRPVDDYPARLLAALRAAAPVGRHRPDRGRAHARASTTPPTSSTRCWPG